MLNPTNNTQIGQTNKEKLKQSKLHFFGQQKNYSLTRFQLYRLQDETKTKKEIYKLRAKNIQIEKKLKPMSANFETFGGLKRGTDMCEGTRKQWWRHGGYCRREGSSGMPSSSPSSPYSPSLSINLSSGLNHSHVPSPKTACGRKRRRCVVSISLVRSLVMI